MTHDPLCTDGKDPDAGPASCCGWCRFAARVRADERGSTLDAAREAVAALRYHLSLPLDDTVIYRTDALAAIDALREGSK